MPQCNRAKSANVPQVRQFLKNRFAGAKLLLFSSPIQQGDGAAWAYSAQTHQRREIRRVRVHRPLHRRRRGHVPPGCHLHAVVPVDRTADNLDSQKKQTDHHHRTDTQLMPPGPTPLGFFIGRVFVGGAKGGGVIFRRRYRISS